MPRKTEKNVHDTIANHCAQTGWTDADASIIWSIGVAGFQAARGANARFPHDKAARIHADTQFNAQKEDCVCHGQ